MNIFERGRMAVNIVFGGTKAIANLVPTWVAGEPTYPEVKFENMVRHGWRKNELIYACINKRSNTASQVELEVLDAEEVPNPNHPLKLLIESPNPYMTEFDFWASVTIYTALAGKAVYEKERDAGGNVINLWPLRPDWVLAVPSGGTDTPLSHYEYQVPGLPPQRIEAEDVLEFKVFDPLGFFNHWPPVAVLSRSGTVDNAVTDFLKLFFEKGAAPPGLLKTVQKLTDSQTADIRRRWGERYGGYEHWMSPAVLDKDASYQRIGLTFNEMGFEALDARNEARICTVLDVPPIIVGAKVGLDRSTFSNYQEARKSWWEDSLVPMYKSYIDVIRNQLGPDFDNPQVRWDYSSVPALQEDQDAIWSRYLTAFSRGAITRNQFLKLVGMEQLEPARGDIYLLPVSLEEVPADTGRLYLDLVEDQQPVMLENGDDSPAEDDDENEDSEDSKGAKMNRKVADDSPDRAKRRRMEIQIQKVTEEFLATQFTEVLQEAEKNGQGG